VDNVWGNYAETVRTTTHHSMRGREKEREREGRGKRERGRRGEGIMS
jgi:hypothetical protein